MPGPVRGWLEHLGFGRNRASRFSRRQGCLRDPFFGTCSVHLDLQLAQLGNENTSRRVAVLRVFFKALENDAVESRSKKRILQSERLGRPIDYIVERFTNRAPQKRPLAGDHFVQYDAEAKDISPVIQLASQCLL